MSTQQAASIPETRCESLEVTNEGVRDSFQISGKNSFGFDDNSSKQTLRKIGSSTSLNSCTSSNLQDYGAKPIYTKLKRSKENGIGERANGKATVDSGTPLFRERLPSFSIRRAIVSNRLQTHFAVYKFVPRHKDELAMNVGDAIHVEKIHADLWCQGTNLMSGEEGIFPSRYASDVLSNTGSSFGKCLVE